MTASAGATHLPRENPGRLASFDVLFDSGLHHGGEHGHLRGKRVSVCLGKSLQVMPEYRVPATVGGIGECLYLGRRDILAGSMSMFSLRGNISTSPIWLSSHDNVASSCTDSIFSGQ